MGRLRYSDFKLQPLRNHRFKLLEPVEYNSTLVPKGFYTDGASVPRVFWSLFPPNRTDYLPCAIIHDYLCDLERYKEADKIFEECLKDIAIPKWQRWLMVNAVKIYHYIKYRKKGYKWVDS